MLALSEVVRILVATWVVAGCSFEHGAMQGQPDAAATNIDASAEQAVDGAVQALRTCRFPDSDLRLCLEFDDQVYSPKVSDASPGKHDAMSNDLLPITRAGMPAAGHGYSSLLSVPETSNLDINEEITMEMWLNPAWPQAVNILSNDGQYSMTLDGYGKIGCSLGGTTAYSSTLVKSDEWTHVACTYDDPYLKIYVNGVASCQFADDREISSGGTTGTRVARNFLGGIDDIRIYSRALTTSEICTHATGGTACASTCSGGSGPGGQGF